MSDEYPGLIEADCNTCAWEKLEAVGGVFNTTGAFMGHPSAYSKCGNKRCPCAAHHDNPCTGSNEPGQPGSLYEFAGLPLAARTTEKTEEGNE